MKNSPKKWVKLFSLAAVGIILFGYTSGPNQDRSGAPGSTGGSAGCGSGCHTGNVNLNSGLSITGLPSSYYPGDTYSMTVSINNPTTKNGFQMSSLNSSNNQAGSFTSITGTKIVTSNGRSIISHNTGSSTGSWTFDWTAPSTNVGDVSFYSCSVASNSNSSNGGDAVYTGNTTINALDVIAANGTVTPTTCSPLIDGHISVNLTGGVAPYTATWSTGFTSTNASHSLSNLAAGNYTVTITDNDGHSEIETFTVNAGQGFSTASMVTHTNCVAQNGAINLSTTGGTAPFAFVWNNGQTNNSMTNLSAGNYIVTVTDAQGCTTVDSAMVADTSSGLFANFNTTFDSCGMGKGGLKILPQTGSAPYSYLWDSGATTDSIFQLANGQYTVTLTDNNGCSDIFSDSVTSTPLPDIDLSSYLDVSCYGDSNGALQINVTSGTAPLMYQWSKDGNVFSTQQNVSNLTAGNYVVEVVDLYGCIDSGFYTVNEPSPLMFNNITVIDDTNGYSLGSISISVTGGNGNFDYVWSHNSQLNAPMATALIGDSIYEVTVTDSLSCSLDTSIYVANLITSISQIDASLPLYLYPNPSKNMNWNVHDSESLLHSLAIYSLNGKLIFNGTQWNDIRLPKGIYMVQLNTINGSSKIEKLIIN